MTPPDADTQPDTTTESAAAPTSLAVAVHNGSGPLPEHLTPLVTRWLKANRINPDQVSSAHPLTILTVPYGPGGDDDTGWLMQIIVFHQFYVGPDGDRELDLLTRQTVCFQRTVPLAVAFPALSETDGEECAQADRQATQETAEEVVRPAGQEGVPHRHEGQGEERPGQGESVRFD